MGNSKTEGVNYLSDWEFASAYNPGPCTYSGDPSRLKPKITAVKINPSIGKKDWKPVKTKAPDCASYEVAKCKDFVGKSKFIHMFALPKDESRVH